MKARWNFFAIALAASMSLAVWSCGSDDSSVNYDEDDSELTSGNSNGGNSSGEGIGCISWDGTVYPDQFWRNHPVGNVLEKPFSEIWGAPPPCSLLDQLRHRKEFLKGRCRTCRWLDLCGGNFRARGEAVTGDLWGEDPTCYLRQA
jgi:radical SAM protein with 4Fe4S-binding SPASM domain